MIGLLIVIGIVVVIAFWAIGIYNGLVQKRAMTEEGWSGIETQLKRRANLIPNLVETVKGYATHESGTLAAVTEMRAKSLGASTVAEQAGAERALSGAIGNLLAVAENYPDLKANENFKELQGELSSLENEIQLSRRYYNGAVRDLNIMIDTFPNNLIAGNFGFKKAEFFEIEDEGDRAVPKVDF